MVQQIVFVDVDDTMVRSVGAKRIPMPAVIAQVRRLKSEGASLFLLSSGGAEYCRTTAIELGLSECFDGYLPKPTAYMTTSPCMNGGFANISIHRRPRMSKKTWVLAMRAHRKI